MFCCTEKSGGCGEMCTCADGEARGGHGMAHGCPGDGQYEVAHLGAASGDQMNGGYPLAILVAARHIWGQAKGAVVAALAGKGGGTQLAALVGMASGRCGA